MKNLLLKALIRKPLTEAAPADGDLAELGRTLERETRRRLGRSLAIRQVDAGSCNACELEIQATANPYYDLDRFGLHFVASPRHADILLVTGPVTRNMEVALRRTYGAMPNPKWVVAAGDCAIDGGCFAGSYAVLDGCSAVIPVDLTIRGCPPEPAAIMKGLVALMRGAGEKGGRGNPDQSSGCIAR